MDSLEKTKTREFTYETKLQESVHRFMLKIAKEAITKANFNSNPEFVKKFRDYNNYEYVMNRWIWDTFFRYRNVEIRYIYESRTKYMADNNVVGWLLNAMTVTPPAAPIVEKKAVVEEKKAVTFGDIDFDEEKVEELEKSKVVEVKKSNMKLFSKQELHQLFGDAEFDKIVAMEVLSEGVAIDRESVNRKVAKHHEDNYSVVFFPVIKVSEPKEKPEVKAVTFE